MQFNFLKKKFIFIMLINLTIHFDLLMSYQQQRHEETHETTIPLGIIYTYNLLYTQTLK